MTQPSSLLVVEDDPIVARALGRLLDRRQVSFATVGTLSDALSAPGPFAAAIIDLELPDGSGLDLFEQLRDTGKIQAAVFFSATTEDTEIAHASALGLFIAKKHGAEMAVDTALRLLEADPASSGEWPRVQTTLATSAAITKTK